MIYPVSVIYKHLERPILQSQGYLIETLSWLFTKSQTDTSPNEITHFKLICNWPAKVPLLKLNKTVNTKYYMLSLKQKKKLWVDHAYFNETNQRLLILKPLFGNTVLFQGFLWRPMDYNPLTIPKPERTFLKGKLHTICACHI